ncbi:hypothetical protein [Streptomyces chumphonensis]|uniref:hypothetical protein n=1 Tax=Streptomyces chumphonensis TaxID=1214925 RepID=UPI003D75E36B
MIANVRSFRRGRLSRAEAVAAAGGLRNDHTVAQVTAALDASGDAVRDVWVADGDLHVPGDLDLTRERVHFLAVLGDLTVDGVYRDSDDPESLLLVTGAMRARDVVTAGWLDVYGDLTTDRLVGDYNDCSARVDGDVRARLFYGENHHFTIGGALLADTVIGRPRLDVAVRPDVIDEDDPRMLEHFDRDLLDVFDDHDANGDAVTCVAGLRDVAEVRRRVAAGLPLRTAGPPGH